MEGSYVKLAEKLVVTKVKVDKVRVDGEHKAYAMQEQQLRASPQYVFFLT